MPPSWQTRTDAKSDGLGNPLIPGALYYVQDVRQIVGNCGSWWAPNGAGYLCDMNEAGQYTGEHCATMRGTDISWPVEYVNARSVAHVRVDTQAFDTRNYKAGPRA